MKYYVASRMTWVPQFNVPRFFEVRDDLESRGIEVQLPADLDDPEVVERLLQSVDGAPETSEATWGDCLALDVKLIADEVDGVVVVDDWFNSRGARLETFVASLCGWPILLYPELTPVPDGDLASAWTSILHGIGTPV